MDYLKIYATFLEQFLRLQRPLKVVFDCSNGTTGLVLQKLFKTNDFITPLLINCRPNGRFPAHGPDPMKKGAMGDLRAAIRKHRADLGVIFDADGDRAFFMDDRGRAIPADVSIALLSGIFSGPMVLNVSAGYLPRETIIKNKKKFFESRTGTYFMKKMMREKQTDFGAEISGHYYFRISDPNNPNSIRMARIKSESNDKSLFFDSGILAAIYMINLTSEIKCQMSLSQWIDNLPQYYRSGELNFRVADLVLKKIEEKYKNQAAKISHLDGLKMEFKGVLRATQGTKRRLSGAWWFNLRPSQTEDLLRLNLEVKDKKIFEIKLKELKRLISTSY